MLRAMFSGRIDVTTDSDGYILIDRSGRHFEFILNYLRDEDPQSLIYYLDGCKDDAELYDLLKEAKFYCIEPLVKAIESRLAASRAATEPYFGSSIVSMVTSKSDLTKILASSEKPFIRLLINRHNNKYSYTANSDDNLLKNIELFERMLIKFKNRIMFIKDTTSTEEICCWYFHGGGRKLSEVCCTSIVYTTEKKQTKVEFPDSKILEEIFVNAVLFESKDNEPVEDEISDEMSRLGMSSAGASNCGSLAASNGALATTSALPTTLTTTSANSTNNLSTSNLSANLSQPGFSSNTNSSQRRSAR